MNDCSTCAARINGMLADYCGHVAFIETHPGEGRVITVYPQIPAWCRGYIPEDEDFEYC